ncbi:MAG: coniferyl aldehyde dehydrogenase [Gammaproteobacteria bacterium]|nr:coniferyl aldehyde dehydrogenase [Gammaproteobacteria bacterium]
MSNEIRTGAAPDTTRDQLTELFARQRQAFDGDRMPPLAERLQHLATLKSLLLEYRDPITRAVDADFTARSRDETLVAEIMPCVEHIGYVQKRLRRWMKPSRRHVGLQFQPARAEVVYQPLGVVGIMVPFNYPLNLGIAPLIAALAAGNRAMLKMSEITPHIGTLLREILLQGFDEDRVAVITGDVDIARAFAALPFDHLLFTGSIPVGKHVMRAAADNLTPVTLELGGKSPAIIAEDIPLDDILDRLVFAKALNAGQTCVAPDYVLVPRARLPAFLEGFKATFNRMYPRLSGNGDYTSVIDRRSYERLQAWLRDAAEKGARIEKVSDETVDDGTHRMAPCLVTAVTDAMTIMQEELFGPILPVIPYDSMDGALAFVSARPRPLALYLFTYDRALQQRVKMHTHAGSMAINEALIQVGIDDLPFGGIGPSGMGHYHSHEGFLTFSKAKSVLTKRRLNSMKLLYPPYGRAIQKWILNWLIR